MTSYTFILMDTIGENSLAYYQTPAAPSLQIDT